MEISFDVEWNRIDPSCVYLLSIRMTRSPLRSRRCILLKMIFTLKVSLSFPLLILSGFKEEDHPHHQTARSMRWILMWRLYSTRKEWPSLSMEKKWNWTSLIIREPSLMYDSNGLENWRNVRNSNMNNGIDHNTRRHIQDCRPQPVQDPCCQEIQWCMETKEVLSVD